MLTDAKCRNVKPSDRQQKLSDGGGLYLLVLPSGGKSWRMAYRFGGKQKVLSFGKYPAVDLADAREKRDAAKKRIEAGTDPAEKEEAPIFETFARRWHDAKKSQWVVEHAERVLSRIERDAFPAIGHKPITEVEPQDIVTLLRKVEERGALDITRRLKQSISSIFRFAIAEGKAKHNPAADVGEALKPKPRVKHFAKVKTKEIPELVRHIHGYDGEEKTRLALLFTLHTGVRTNEIRFADWSEFEDIDGDEPLWRLPEHRMKMRREHLVPLSRQAIELLRQIRRLHNGDQLIDISQNTMIYALYRMGYHSRQTVHGFRGLASTVLNEANWNKDWVEMQLAHDEEDEVRGAYNSAEYIAGRRKMMQWWSDYLSAAIQPSMSDSRQRTEAPPTETGRGNSPRAMRR